jgi:lipopolysaccharide biosynthesis glycosyltransferase
MTGVSVVDDDLDQCRFFEGTIKHSRSPRRAQPRSLGHKTKTAIVVVADETYLPAACCAVISCRCTGRVTEPIFLVVSNVSDNNVQAARRFLNDRRADTEIIRLPIDLSGYRVDRWISPAAYARLHLDDIFDGGWDRVLYLDADTRVFAPLWPLLQADLNGRVLGAVDNLRDENHTERLSMAVDSRYFNSGVLLFDWPAVLSAGLLAQCRYFAVQNPHLCELYDQDALNKVFEGLWTPLHLRWNYAIELARRLPRERASIKHYNYKDKPWGPKKREFWIADSFWYWRILRRSPWPDFAHPITVRHINKGLRWLYRTRFSERWLMRNQVTQLRNADQPFIEFSVPTFDT